MKLNLKSISWVIISFPESSTCNPASARRSSPKWAKFTVRVNHHNLNKDHVSVLREMMELNKWAVALSVTIRSVTLWVNPTENGLLRHWKAILRVDSYRDILHVCMYKHTHMYGGCWNQADLWNSEPEDTLWVAALFVHKK